MSQVRPAIYNVEKHMVTTCMYICLVSLINKEEGKNLDSMDSVQKILINECGEWKVDIILKVLYSCTECIYFPVFQ